MPKLKQRRQTKSPDETENNQQELWTKYFWSKQERKRTLQQTHMCAKKNRLIKQHSGIKEVYY